VDRAILATKVICASVCEQWTYGIMARSGRIPDQPLGRIGCRRYRRSSLAWEERRTRRNGRVDTPSVSNEVPSMSCLPQHRSPDPRLAPFVEVYHEVRTPNDATVEHVVVPRGGSGMVFTLAGHYQGALGERPFEDIPPAIAHGQFTCWATNRFSKGHHGFLVMFTAIGWHGLTGQPALALTDGFEDLVLANSGDADAMQALVDGIEGASSFDERCDVADGILGGLLERRGNHSRALELAAAGADRIREAAGVIGVGDLAKEIATTERTLRRAFDRAVGISPKTFASIQRVNRVIVDLHRNPPCDWQDLVDAYGYADQSHFGREFRRLTGLSPSAYLPENHPLEKSFAAIASGAA